MKILTLTLMILISGLTVGCYNKIELEERRFAGVLTVDLVEEGFSLGVDSLNISKDKSSEGDEKAVARKTGENFTAAMGALKDASSKIISFGLSKVVIFGEDLLKDNDRLSEAVFALEKNNETSGKMLVMAAKGEAAGILKNHAEKEISLGYYISKYYKHARGKHTSSYMMELETLAETLREGGGALIPLISFEEESKAFAFSGAALINGCLAGFAEDEELHGLSWVKGLGRGRLLHLKTDQDPAALKISGQRANVGFYEDEGLVCHIRINASGELEEYSALEDGRIYELERLFAELILKEIKETHLFLASFGIDGYDLEERFYKKKPKLHRAYGGLPGSYDMDISVAVRINN